jgi:hypothetical protein
LRVIVIFQFYNYFVKTRRLQASFLAQFRLFLLEIVKKVEETLRLFVLGESIVLSEYLARENLILGRVFDLEHLVEGFIDPDQVKVGCDG